MLRDGPTIVLLKSEWNLILSHHAVRENPEVKFKSALSRVAENLPTEAKRCHLCKNQQNVAHQNVSKLQKKTKTNLINLKDIYESLYWRVQSLSPMLS